MWLQRSAGNSAVAGVLAREPEPGPIPAAGQTSGEPVGPEFEVLTTQERNSIVLASISNVIMAANAFATACGAHHAALARQAKVNSEFAALAIDVFSGFLAPGIANFVGGHLLEMFTKKLIGSQARLVSFKSPALTLVTTMAQDKDMVKAAFTAATKTTGQLLKNEAQPLFGETDKDLFLKGLQVTFNSGASELTQRLAFDGLNGGMPAEELLAIWHCYDNLYTSIPVYEQVLTDLLSQFEMFVQGQGFEISQIGQAGEGEIETERRIYSANLYGEDRLILVGRIAVNGPDDTDDRVTYSFNGYVPEELRAAAVARSTSLFGPIATISPDTIGGEIPPP